MRALSVLLLVLAACGDDGLTIYNMAPAVRIVSPIDGAELPERETIVFEGVVDDDANVTELEVDWVDSVSGVLEEGARVEPNGSVVHFNSALEEGPHSIVLRAYDAWGEGADARVDITILDVPDKPSIRVVHPDVLGSEKGLDGTSFIFMAEVSDHQDPAEDLVVEVVASPYGLVCTMSPDGSGIAQCPANLPLGPYTLTFTVTDTEDNVAIANAPFQVVTRGDYDMDGDGYSPNAGDCNDSAIKIYPGADEICDGLDNDCNERTAIDVGTECYDDDGDGYCEDPPCTNTSNTLADCDDTNPSRYPDPRVREVVNGLDDDCDGLVDEGTNVYDDDGDGYCESPPCINAAGAESDCDDDAYAVNPGEDEVCGDGIDNDCNTLMNEEDAIGCTEFYYDEDGDTYGVPGSTECWCDAGSYPYTGNTTNDCYDANASAHPGQLAYFPVDRGDGSFDYDCNRTPEKQYRGVTTGCDWSFEPFTCNIKADGWKGSEPSCGVSGTWSGDCSGSYDVVCIFFCIYGDPALCTSCWDCDPDEDSLTQACR